MGVCMSNRQTTQVSAMRVTESWKYPIHTDLRSIYMKYMYLAIEA